MADHETSKIMWITIGVGLAASIFTVARPQIKSISASILGDNGTVSQVVHNTSDTTVAPPVGQSQQQIATKSTLNFDLARHPMTATELNQLIDVMPSAGFTQLSLRLSDNTHFMYQSEYLKNTNPEALSTKDLQSVIAHAKEKGIVIVPDLDTPSHSASILSALKVSHPDVYSKVAMDDATLDYTTPEALEIAKTLYGEVFNIFKGQSTQAIVIGADEVPGSDDTYSNYLIPFVNELAKTSTKAGFAPILWNDSILKTDVSKLSKDFSIYYWAQAAHAQGDAIITRGQTRATVKDFVNAGLPVINANDYATTYHMKSIGDTGSEDYFYNYLENTSNPTLFNEVVDNQSQWWTQETTPNHGMVVSIWGENSDNISSKQIIDFVSKIKLPAVPSK